MKSSYDSLKNIALERVEARIAALLLKLANKIGVKTDEGTLIDILLLSYLFFLNTYYRTLQCL